MVETEYKQLNKSVKSQRVRIAHTCLYLCCLAVCITMFSLNYYGYSILVGLNVIKTSNWVLQGSDNKDWLFFK